MKLPSEASTPPASDFKSGSPQVVSAGASFHKSVRVWQPLVLSLRGKFIRFPCFSSLQSELISLTLCTWTFLARQFCLMPFKCSVLLHRNRFVEGFKKKTTFEAASVTQRALARLQCLTRRERREPELSQMTTNSCRRRANAADEWCLCATICSLNPHKPSKEAPLNLKRRPIKQPVESDF